ncbi:MAG: hypothetical protein QM796_02230 [Chthoniobacteraceae bacterium]
METLRIFRLLLWVHWRSLLARVRGVRQQSRLMLFVLALFVAGYLLLGYWLFKIGLGFLYHFAIVGSLLLQRILFLIFGFVFLMLIFSNLVIGYTTLFKNRETSWLLTLPLTHKTIYRWKFLEALCISSWALIFLSAPMMVAYGQVREVPGWFYVQVISAYFPFVVLPALIGSWLILVLVRVLSRSWVQKTLLALAGLGLLALVFWIKPITDEDATTGQDVISFDQLLQHTRITLNPFLPSAWMARLVLAWSEGLDKQGIFFFLLLLSYALMGLWIGFEWVGRAFYPTWTRTASLRARQFQEQTEKRRTQVARMTFVERIIHLWPGASRPLRALALKDFRTFWRDPAQWTQFMIFFGLLCIYVLNLRNNAFTFRNEFWETMISYLNLAAASLTLSTLTTRFVFPQFSLEGRRLWIIGLAPISLSRVLMQKFWMACIASMSITVTLMIVSSLMLHLETVKVIFFAAAIAMMSATLCSLAVGLGALFPNLKEDNPSKIVSGFGGTLCLVSSFIYIACFVFLAAIPAVRKVAPVDFFVGDELALTLAGLLSIGMSFLPLFLASHRVKNLEF